MKKVWVIYEARSETEGKVYKWVKCVETKEVFPSSIAAGIEMGISSSSIRKVCKGVHQQAKGYTFVYLKGGDLPCP